MGFGIRQAGISVSVGGIGSQRRRCNLRHWFEDDGKIECHEFEGDESPIVHTVAALPHCSDSAHGKCLGWARIEGVPGLTFCRCICHCVSGLN